MIHISFTRLITRLCALCLGVGIIYTFLYMPHIIERFRTKKSISILAWPLVLSADYLSEFEQKTGIKVYITYFENYEELFVKLQSGDAAGYDLIMPSDYAADLFIKQGLLKKIDKSKLNFWSDMYQTLLGHYYDPDNTYSIPFSWEVYGLGIDTTYYDGELPRASWGLIFDPAIAPPKVGMLDDAREIALIAAQYLFGSIEDLDEQKIEQIIQLLVRQKKWVASYTDLRTDYLLLSQTVPVALGYVSDINRVMRRKDTVKFLIPEEGSFALLDLFAIPAASQKDDLIYQFLNYLYQPHVIKQYIDTFGFYPPRKNVQPEDPLFAVEPKPDLFKKLHFFKNVIPEHFLNKLWIALKS